MTLTEWVKVGGRPFDMLVLSCARTQSTTFWMPAFVLQISAGRPVRGVMAQAVTVMAVKTAPTTTGACARTLSMLFDVCGLQAE
jgi:hypothetical protein